MFQKMLLWGRIVAHEKSIKVISMNRAHTRWRSQFIMLTLSLCVEVQTISVLKASMPHHHHNSLLLRDTTKIIRTEQWREENMLTKALHEIAGCEEGKE
jgi:hypothetical protein